MGKFLDTYPSESEPDGDVTAPHHAYVGMLVTWFSFQYVWPHYPRTGATGSILGVLITADDVISHAVYKDTPFDLLWQYVIRGALGVIEA